MNSNGHEVEFRQHGDEVDMWVERDRAPFDDYLCGILRKDEEGFFRFHPCPDVVMHCKLLRTVAAEAGRLNAKLGCVEVKGIEWLPSPYY